MECFRWQNSSVRVTTAAPLPGYYWCGATCGVCGDRRLFSVHHGAPSRGALDEDMPRDFFKQVVNTVIECQVRGVDHRDIKDKNVILNTASGKLNLVDFGSGAFSQTEPYTAFDGKKNSN